MSNCKWLFTLADSLASMDLTKQDQLRLSKSVRECAENWEAERADHVILRQTLTAVYANAREEADAAAARNEARLASVVQPDRYVVKQAFGSFYVKDLHEMTSVATCAFEALADAYCAALNAAAHKAAP